MNAHFVAFKVNINYVARVSRLQEKMNDPAPICVVTYTRQGSWPHSPFVSSDGLLGKPENERLIYLSDTWKVMTPDSCSNAGSDESSRQLFAADVSQLSVCRRSAAFRLTSTNFPQAVAAYRMVI